MLYFLILIQGFFINSLFANVSGNQVLKLESDRLIPVVKEVPHYGKVLRVGNQAFKNLPRFVPGKDYISNYIDVGTKNRGGIMRMHYATSKNCLKKNAEPFLLLHGEPHWSFFFRDVFPVLNKAGY